jgi:hypothetical protein
MKRFLRLCARPDLKPAVQEKGLRDKEHDGEEDPIKSYGVKPPILQFCKAAPQVLGIDHVKPAKPDEQGRALSLPREALFDSFEEGYAIFWLLQALDRG